MQITIWEGHGASPLQFHDCKINLDSPRLLMFEYVGKATRKRRKASFNTEVIAGWSSDRD
jgi:hypothetical protein